MMNRPSPPKPWERGGSTGNISSLPTRSISPTNTPSNINSSNGTIPSPVNSNINSINNTNNVNSISQSGSIMSRPRTPMRPGGSSIYSSSSFDDYSMTGNRPYSNGYGTSYGAGGGGYGSSYGTGGTGYGSSYGTGGTGYGSGYGSSYGAGGGGYGSSYGAGGGYGSSYGSSYGAGGGYGSSYGAGGGYGSSYGGGYGGGYGSTSYGNNYGGGYGHRGEIQDKPGGAHNWMEALHSIVDTFSRFSRLLDANFDAVHVSFISILRLCQSVTHFNREILGMIKTFTVFKLLQPLGARILRLIRFILGRPVTTANKTTISSSIQTGISKTNLHGVGETLQGIDVSDFKAFEKTTSQGKGIGYFILIIFVTFIGIPTLIGHLLNMSRNRKKETTLESSWNLGEVTKVRALHDFDAETPRDLPLRVGDIVNVIGKPHEEWWEGEIDGRTGLFPLCYVQILDENNNNITNNSNLNINGFSNSSSNNNINNNIDNNLNSNIENNNNNNNSFNNNNDYQLTSNYSSFDHNNNQLRYRPKSPKKQPQPQQQQQQQ